MAVQYGAVIAMTTCAILVCTLATLCCVLLVSLSLKLYTEIMKGKVMAARKPEHKCVCMPWRGVTSNGPPPKDAVKPSPPPSPPVKGVPLREATRIARKIINALKHK
jgi:hypothetical protein